MPIKVFITDDHYMIIEGIRSLLIHEAEIEWMGHAMNAASCLAFLSGQMPDVLLLDVNLPDMSGIDLCKIIRANHPKIKIIGLSSHSQQSFIQKMLENGAMGYVLKNATREELVSAICSVKQGEQFLSHEASMSIKNKTSLKIPLVTRREKDVLLLISEGMTNGEIADKLFISSTTVDTHRKNLLAKFEVKNTAALVRIATQLGII